MIVGILKKEYPETQIYDEKVPQRFDTSSFFTRIISCSHEKVIGRRYFRRYSMAVRYYDDSNESLEAMARELYGVLEYPMYETEAGRAVTLRSKRMNHHIEDGTLHFFFDITVYLDRPEESGAQMEELKVNKNLK